MVCCTEGHPKLTTTWCLWVILYRSQSLGQTPYLEECDEASMADHAAEVKRLQWFGHLMEMPTP